MLNGKMFWRTVMDEQKKSAKPDMKKKITVIHLDESDLSADWIKEMRIPEDEKIKKGMEREKKD